LHLDLGPNQRQKRSAMRYYGAKLTLKIDMVKINEKMKAI
jgi:hypothetical protein